MLLLRRRRRLPLQAGFVPDDEGKRRRLFLPLLLSKCIISVFLRRGRQHLYTAICHLPAQATTVGERKRGGMGGGWWARREWGDRQTHLF